LTHASAIKEAAVALESLNTAFWVAVAVCSIPALLFALVGSQEHTDNRHIFDNLRAIWWTLATILIVLITNGDVVD
jgi:hypothetical protein